MPAGRAEPPAGHAASRWQRRGPPPLDRPHHYGTAQGTALAGARQHRTERVRGRDFALVRRGNQRCAHPALRAFAFSRAALRRHADRLRPEPPRQQVRNVRRLPSGVPLPHRRQRQQRPVPSVLQGLEGCQRRQRPLRLLVRTLPARTFTELDAMPFSANQLNLAVQVRAGAVLAGD